MKPIIIDMKEISDSTELYDAKPNRFLIYTIYLILFLLVVAVLWMYFSKIEIVIKSNGVFKGGSAIYEITSGVTGSVKENLVESGQYVKEGEILYVLNIEELSDTILRYQDELEASKDRLEILFAYKESLENNKDELDLHADNPYYGEFADRRALLYANASMNENNTDGQVALYQGNADSISDDIATYNGKINKLNAVKQCVVTRNNSFDASESIYYSMVNSYLASYNYTTLQYDNQINEYQKQIDAYDEQIKHAQNKPSNEEEPVIGNETISGNDFSTMTISNLTQSSNHTDEVESLKKQRDSFVTARDLINQEKMQALTNLELQQLASIEQQISGYHDAILSLETNLTSTKLQLDTVNGVDNDTKETVSILMEKGNIAAEILTYENKVKEYETYLKSYDIQNNNCIIKANMSGYFYGSQELKAGSFVPEGTAIGTIYPEAESKYFAEIYVENSDIAKIKEGQDVKFEIAAYPSNEYGYFEGVVENIAKDISVDQNTGYAYYLVKVNCNNLTLKGKEGEEVTLINGMACQAKIIVDEKNVLTYLLEKIDLLD